jgi:hypothetical protein
MPFDQLIPRPFKSSSVHMYAPVAPGVYGISNAREWLYIGHAEDIQGALLAHLVDTRGPLMKHAPTGFTFEICEGGRCPGRQSRLVLEYAPTCNPRGQKGYL